MCGFVGLKDKNIKDYQRVIKNMTDRIIHRGPDEEGYYIENNVALGFRRLAIIDLKDGSQPMYNEDKSLVIVFNGEIYNYQDLKKDLIKKHTFKTNCDTEVLLHGYEEYKEELFNKLRGMFSFTIYDIKNDKLIGVRDYFGIKPYYYYNNAGVFIFGSEIKSFLDEPNFKKIINDKCLKPYLTFQNSPLEETFFKYTYKLKPGHYYTYQKDVLSVKSYFEPKYNKTDKPLQEYENDIESTLNDSIKAHLISDVEVGSYLSGGVDSSYVVAQALPSKTFTVGFKQEGFDESSLAKELSNSLNIENDTKLITADEFFEALPKVQYYTDEPLANLSTVPLYFLAALAHKKVKVVLSGEGSDEMFGGYNEYYEAPIFKLYKVLPLKFRKFLANKVKDKPSFKGKTTIMYYSKSLEERYVSHAFIMNNEEANDIIASRLKNGINYEDVVKDTYDKVKDLDEVSKKMFIDLNFWLPNDILLKADKMSMSSSVELRVPFLDKEIWKISSYIPSKYLVKDGQTKYAFRKVSKKILPIDWAKRRKKGFPVPFSKWIEEEKYMNMIKSTFNETIVDTFFEKEKINKLLEEHYEKRANNGRKIYTIYTFLIWYKQFFA